jgi:hypothetical protein
MKLSRQRKKELKEIPRKGNGREKSDEEFSDTGSVVSTTLSEAE